MVASEYSDGLSLVQSFELSRRGEDGDGDDDNDEEDDKKEAEDEEGEENGHDGRGLEQEKTQEEPPIQGYSPKAIVARVRRNWRRWLQVAAVKPIMILFGLQFAIVGTVSQQLWLDKTCSVNLGYNATVCANLPMWEEAENAVQQKVTSFGIVGNWIEAVPGLVLSLYLGPWSDRGRKPLLVLPFVGSMLSTVVYMVNVATDWPAQLIWLNYVSIFFGGFSVLNIAMNGYIGDVTAPHQRTAMMSFLYGLSLVVWPLAEFLGGQIFNAGGYYAVYASSLAISVLGLLYIAAIPESVTIRTRGMKTEMAARQRGMSTCGKLVDSFKEGNKQVALAAKCAFQARSNGTRHIILFVLVVRCTMTLDRGGADGFLFAQKQFDWGVVQYTNYMAFMIAMYTVQTMVTTPLYSYTVGMHDCLLAVTGTLANIAMHVFMGLATDGWMMYAATSFIALGAVHETPLTAILSKCVDPDEFGKIFSVSGLCTGLAGLAASTAMSVLYKATLGSFAGAQYLVLAAIETLTLALIVALYVIMRKHESKRGVVGKGQNKYS